jgi:hypothetical protein
MIAPALRYAIAGLLGATAMIAAAGIIRFAWLHPDTEPANLRLHEVLLVSVIIAAFVLFPWERTRWRVKKVGWIEFDRIVTTQKKEQIESVALIEKRISILEDALALQRSSQPADRPGTESDTDLASARPGEGTGNDELRRLVLAFLKAHPSWYFNAARIQNWGAGRPGFGKLGEYPTVLITQELHRLLAAGLVRHRISKRSGGSLYRYHAVS